jgi:hypothetical protein
VILCFRDLLQDALSDRLEERIPFLTSSIKVTISALPFFLLRILTCKSDGALGTYLYYTDWMFTYRYLFTCGVVPHSPGRAENTELSRGPPCVSSALSFIGGRVSDPDPDPYPDPHGSALI